MDLVDAIVRLGFPVAVVCYLLLRFEKKLDWMTRSMDGLTRGILIEVLTRRDVPRDVERSARELLDEIALRSGSRA